MSLRSLWARVKGRSGEVFHCSFGAFHLRRGNLSRARDHYLRAIESGRPSFRAHVNLGRIFLKQNGIPQALEELRRARELDPHRFSREGFPGEHFLWIAERLPDGRVQRNVAVNRPASGLSGQDLEPEAYEAEVEELPFGDFTGRDEAERFSLLPPIALTDAEEIDWDALGRDLIDEE